MGIEEQKEEREVLESIFPDEISGTTSNHFLVDRI
jgi:RWD domain